MFPRSAHRRLRAALVGALALSAVPATAQLFERPYGPFRYNTPPPLFDPLDEFLVGRAAPLPPRVIMERLEDQGYEDVGRPRYNGRSYVVDATTPRGRRVSLLVDPFRGGVVDRMPIGDPRGREEAGGWNDPPPREAVRPGRPFPPEEPSLRENDPRRREAARPERPFPPEPPAAPAPAPSEVLRREPARPDISVDRPPSGEPALKAPADPRVAPSPGPREAGRPLEGRAGAPNAAEPDGRIEPATPARAPREAARSEPGGPVYGTNPGAGQPARRKPPEQAKPSEGPKPVERAKPSDSPKPVEEARTPNPPAPVAVPVPSAAPPAPAPAQASATPLSKPRGPVRIIEGVTPINPTPAPPAPAPAPAEKKSPGASE